MGKSYDATGTIYTMGETTSYGENGFTKREFVIKLTGEGENEAYPNYIALELIKDKCDLISQYEIGREIKVYFNLSGRLWNGNDKPERCFNALQAWKIEAMKQSTTQQPKDFDESRYMPDATDNGEDEIPF